MIMTVVLVIGITQMVMVVTGMRRRVGRDPSTGMGGLGGDGGYAGPDLDRWFFEGLEWGGEVTVIDTPTTTTTSTTTIMAEVMTIASTIAITATMTMIITTVTVGEVVGDG